MFSFSRFSSLALVTFLLNPALAYEITPKQYGDNNKEELHLCSPTRTEEFIYYMKETLPENFPNLPKYTITEDWRTQDLETDKIPLSKAVILENPITGTTAGVFDRNWNRTFRISSFFGRNIIRIRMQSIINVKGRVPLTPIPIPGKVVTGTTFVESLGIKTKNGYIVINGCDGVFKVNKEVADALSDYPLDNKKAFILLSDHGSTGLRINEIGPKTVKAWKIIYQNWDPEIDGKNKLYKKPTVEKISDENLKKSDNFSRDTPSNNDKFSDRRFPMDL